MPMADRNRYPFRVNRPSEDWVPSPAGLIDRHIEKRERRKMWRPA